MKRAKAFSTVNWKKYLDVNTNPRANRFLESRGDDVLWQIASEINRAVMTPGQENLIILVHPNAGAVIKIDKSEFGELLQLCLNWFEKREDYSKCAKIQKFILNQKKSINLSKTSKKYEETII